MSDSGEEITVDNHTNVQKPKDTNEFSAVDAIDIALDKQRSSLVSELQEKLQVNTDIKGEGIKIQFSFNQERLSNLDRFKNYLSRGSVEEVFELIDSEKKALTHRNKLLRIADRHGWGTVKEYSDNDLTDNSEDASKLRAAIFRASKKRQTPYARNQPTQPSFQRTRPGVFDGMSNNQLFLGSQNYGQRQIFNPRPQFQNYRQNFTPGANVTCHYCNLPGHFAKFCPYTAQLQRRQPAAATVTNPEPFNKQQRGNSVVIAKTRNELCPVFWLRKYIALAGIIEKSDEFLFTAINFMKISGEYKATNKSKSLSYTRCREILRSALKDIGLDSSLYALHSLRSGGVSAAANNKVPDRLLKVHGRWATDRAKDGYIKDSIEQKLLVSLNLGL
ncbi:unnamed protein product [Mytilus edulis]|uniref:Uncharacterized protein n=1 Tax=Mytilus edulis TaxID=6550 RepID=A0A8S3PUE8_MYTED|nr:unnamed protein product [Mytilus edulis]